MQTVLGDQGQQINFVLSALEGEARVLEEEAWMVAWSACHVIQPAPTPGRAAELEAWKQEVHTELKQGLHEKLATLGKMLMSKLRQQWSQALRPPPRVQHWQVAVA
ncbi:hypothetical protein AAFF_G00024070 [Aldrovandia affinis]|uniref:Uncharacterized protein n=1 Tax=Aldrovandia affinis TaxID=143900 RepID=A0AAD7X0G6_9TELE|nr:hypothetical protein AAFF_G00024070 [Aldrovandia affinis]